MISRLCRKTKNPFNIRYDKRNNWIGQIGQIQGFCKFSDEEYGLRAGIKLLNRYLENGFTSVGSIIRRFAPPSENDTTSYIKFVYARLVAYGFNPHYIVPRSDAFVCLCVAIAYYETQYVLTDVDVRNIMKKWSV